MTQMGEIGIARVPWPRRRKSPGVVIPDATKWRSGIRKQQEIQWGWIPGSRFARAPE
jgi:hypothetical protein